MFDSGYSTEYAYWHGGAGTSDKGSMLTWTLGTAGLLPPSGYSADKRAKMCLPTSSDSVWKIDDIPSRVEELRTMLAKKTAIPTLHYVHCEAGCDRTGELSGAYMMKYNAPKLPGSPTPPQWYAADNCSAGRYPNYYSTSALQWCVQTVFWRRATRACCRPLLTHTLAPAPYRHHNRHHNRTHAARAPSADVTYDRNEKRYCYYLKFGPDQRSSYTDDDCTLHAKCKLFGDCTPNSTSTERG